MNPRHRVLAAGGALGVLLALVGGIALVASYWHARALAHAYRSPLDTIPDLSAWLPLTTDGLLIGAFAVIYWRRLAQLEVPRLAWAGAALAGAGTVAANLATAHPSVTGWIVAGWAPVTFTLVDFLVAILIPPLVTAWRHARADDDWPLPEPTTVTPSHFHPPFPAGGPAWNPLEEIPPIDGVPDLPDPNDVSTWAFPGPPVVAEAYQRATATVSTLPTADEKPASEDDAAAVLAAELADGTPLPSARALRARWGYRHDKAVRVLELAREKAS